MHASWMHTYSMNSLTYLTSCSSLGHALLMALLLLSGWIYFMLVSGAKLEVVGLGLFNQYVFSDHALVMMEIWPTSRLGSSGSIRVSEFLF